MLLPLDKSNDIKKNHNEHEIENIGIVSNYVWNIKRHNLCKMNEQKPRSRREYEIEIDEIVINSPSSMCETWCACVKLSFTKSILFSACQMCFTNLSINDCYKRKHKDQILKLSDNSDAL